MNNEEVKIVIPSYKRAGRVTTHKHVANCAICVSVSEAPVYREAYPELEIIEHPDDIIGYSPKAQWLLERYPDLFLIDDDVTGMMRKYHEGNSGISPDVTAQTAYDLIQTRAAMCREMGGHLFGFSATPNPLTYHGFKPFRFTGFIVGGACGYLRGSKLRFNHEFTAASDYWMALLNAYHHRFCLVDERFCFKFKDTFGSTGGVAEYRSLKTEEEDFEKLQVYFGKAIELKKGGYDKIRKAVNPWEKRIVLPY